MSSSDPDALKPRRGYLSGDDARAFESWSLPNVGRADSAPKSDMFGYTERAGRPLDEEPQDVMPPTMAELEQIRAEAEQEGFAEGQARGYAQGLEEGNSEGQEQGYAAGFEQGQQQGFDAGMQRSNDVLAKLESAMAQLQAPLALMDTEVEMELLRLTMILAKSVVMAELKIHPEQILVALRQGVDALPLKQQQVLIRVHPEDARRIGEAYSHSQLERQGWDIEQDPSMHEGDCIVSTQRSSVDLRLAERLEQVLLAPQSELEELQREYQSKTDAIAAQHDLTDNRKLVSASEELPASDTENPANEPADADSANPDEPKNDDGQAQEPITQ
ncbi:flagellar assembly protein FliH [Shewanella sp. GXUN23E]|uniref:flagellar assembly protein FliH n=1 Tax=Shewanella sp. GXUN23E TaxID=3422498 RepID=UPI003D7E1A1A